MDSNLICTKRYCRKDIFPDPTLSKRYAIISNRVTKEFRGVSKISISDLEQFEIDFPGYIALVTYIIDVDKLQG